ncbi:MAG: nitroreductase family protein [Neisseria sp.]|nr:nitroreductase family protein [Neisseria sp.]
MTDTLELLTTRRSTKTLAAPAPDELQLDTILQAATQVPDHGLLTPYRFVVIQSEEGIARYQQLLRDTVALFKMGEEAAAKAERVGKMAPMTIAVIASPVVSGENRKPEWEQHLSAGCAAYAVQLAAKAQGFDNVWISGIWVNSPLLREAFACAEHEKIIGLIKIGTAPYDPSAAKNTDTDRFTAYW